MKPFVIAVALLLQVCKGDRKGSGLTFLSNNLQGLVTEYLTPLGVAKAKMVGKSWKAEMNFKCLAGGLFEHKETSEIIFEAEGREWWETELPEKLSWCRSKREEFEEYIEERDWDSLFNRISGDFSKKLQESLADIVKDTDAALERAIPFGTARTVEKLLKRKTKAELNAYGVDWCGWTRLIEAVDTGRVEIVETLLKFGADVNGTDKNGETALMRAVVTNKNGLVKLLLERGACRFIQGFRGNALDIAKKRGYTEIIAQLELYTERIKRFESKPQTKEEEKAERSSIFRLFIDEKDKRGETALMSAVRKNDVGAVEVLLAHSAQLEIKNNKGKSALDIAQGKKKKKNGQSEIIKKLQDKMQEKNQENKMPVGQLKM